MLFNCENTLYYVQDRKRERERERERERMSKREQRESLVLW
jgi:hypothetical protein